MSKIVDFIPAKAGLGIPTEWEDAIDAATRYVTMLEKAPEISKEEICLNP